MAVGEAHAQEVAARATAASTRGVAYSCGFRSSCSVFTSTELSDWQRSRSHSAWRSTPPTVTVLPFAEIAVSVERFASRSAE